MTGLVRMAAAGTGAWTESRCAGGGVARLTVERNRGRMETDARAWG